MPLANTAARYGTVAKTFHWLVALLMLSQIALGIAGSQPGLGARLDLKVRILETHKLLGIAIFAVALLRIVWALVQPKPAPVHPDRRLETFAAETVHVALYAALIVMPATGWIGHAASEGFAPIPWPLGQSLPLVPKSAAVSQVAFTAHWLFAWILGGALVLHIGAALKHAILDRDGTLSRMWFGRTEARAAPAGHPEAGPALLFALAIYVAGAVGVVALSAPGETASSVAAQTATGTGDWQVDDGTLTIAVTQFGNRIEGRFADWNADITFDPDASQDAMGQVTVRVRIPSLTLGSVTQNALGPDYLAAETHPEAVFTGPIRREGEAYVADGTLDLAGQSAQVALPFTLDLSGDTAAMAGEITVDRRTFGIGGDGTSTLGADVVIDVALTATRIR